MEYNLAEFEEQLRELGLEINEKQKKQFIEYYELLIEWNEKMNLTAITEWNDVLEKHFLDSLSVVRVIDLKQPIRVLDLGTGAGFPGIPLKILFPELDIVLMDSLQKRITFLNEVIQRLSLNKIIAVHGRAEEMARNQSYREQFDLCFSRAVANLSTLSEYCLPFVKLNGKFISYKGDAADEELEKARKACFLLGGKIEQVDRFQLGRDQVNRTFVLISKEKKTPKQYPRKAGTPSKSPL